MLKFRANQSVRQDGMPGGEQRWPAYGLSSSLCLAVSWRVTLTSLFPGWTRINLVLYHKTKKPCGLKSFLQVRMEENITDDLWWLDPLPNPLAWTYPVSIFLSYPLSRILANIDIDYRTYSAPYLMVWQSIKEKCEAVSLTIYSQASALAVVTAVYRIPLMVMRMSGSQSRHD